MTRQVWLPERVKKVDQVGDNVLVRGCMPLAGDPWHFAYGEIGQAAGLDLGAYHFVDISLIDCTGERYMLEPEMEAMGLMAPQPSFWPPFGRKGFDPSVGNETALRTESGIVPATFYWWPIEGLPEGVDPAGFVGKPGWDLSGLVELMDGLMSGKGSRPKAAYIHCTLGADRTGAAHTSYLVRRGMKLERASATADASTSAGAPTDDYKRLRAAYAASRR